MNVEQLAIVMRRIIDEYPQTPMPRKPRAEFYAERLAAEVAADPTIAGPRETVTFWDPSVSPPRKVALTPRDAARAILTLQAVEGEDNDVDPLTSYPEMTSIDTVLRLAGDSECYLEHTEANLIPNADESHAFVPTGDEWDSCEVCGCERDDDRHAPAAPSVGEAPPHDPFAEEAANHGARTMGGELLAGGDA